MWREAMSLEIHTNTAFWKHKRLLASQCKRPQLHYLTYLSSQNAQCSSICVFRPIRSESDWFWLLLLILDFLSDQAFSFYCHILQSTILQGSLTWIAPERSYREQQYHRLCGHAIFPNQLVSNCKQELAEDLLVDVQNKQKATKIVSGHTTCEQWFARHFEEIYWICEILQEWKNYAMMGV